MSTIIFVMLPEPGHLNPSFRLAKTLSGRGHRVIYFGAQDCEADVRAQGLEFIPVFEESLPPGYQTVLAHNAHHDPTFKGDTSIRNLIADQMRIIYGNKAELIRIIDELKPNLFVVDNLLPTMALVAHEMGLLSIFLNVTFNAFDDYQGTTTLLPILKVPEMVLCPQDFDLPQAKYGVRRRFYIEPSIDLERKEVAFPWNLISKHKPLIYCSLGTQTHFYKQESLHFYHCLIRAMEQRPDWQLVLSAGSHVDCGQLQADLPNVLVVNRAPQLEMLKRAAMMITHGGLGSIKECIFFGVPMIVFPLGRDQPRNAARVVYHHLGVRGDISRVSVETIQSFINRIDRDHFFKVQVELMGTRFREMETAQRGVKMVEKLMNIFELKEAKEPPRPGMSEVLAYEVK